MKMKEKKSELVDKSPKQQTLNGKVDKKKKKDNFEVHVPRVIIRNLSFKVNEEKLKNTFEKSNIGVKNISIVTKDGQSKGFGFVTFDKLDDAKKAIETVNGQKLLGRPMALDWCLPKNVYEKMHSKEATQSNQSDSYGIQSKVKESEVKQETENIQEAEEEEEEDDDIEEEMEVDEDEEEEDEENVDDEKPSKSYTTESSRDVREHRTLFVRNIPFDATEDELSNLFSSNGERRVVSCRLVVDPVSRHSRGSAFIQFASSNDAEQCLNVSLTLRGQQLHADIALGRNELAKAKELRDEKSEKDKKRDQRNLSLANYGVILKLDDLDGNENDLRKRQQLEDIKKQKLKNSLFFVSPTRLTIHNLPKNMDDSKLRKVIIETLKKDKLPMKDITPNECRVMRNTKDAKKSLGFGFIGFARHETALRLLDLLNNNKYVFGPSRRPIVQFSIENRQALQLKEERRERLKAKQELLKNPTNKTLTFDSKKKRKERQHLNSFNQKNNLRLSELIKQQKEVKDELNQDHDEGFDQSNNYDDNFDNSQLDSSNNSTMKKRKRSKTKSKGEIRDNIDRMIAKTRNKPQLPKKTKKKWFE